MDIKCEQGLVNLQTANPWKNIVFECWIPYNSRYCWFSKQMLVWSSKHKVILLLQNYVINTQSI